MIPIRLPVLIVDTHIRSLRYLLSLYHIEGIVITFLPAALAAVPSTSLHCRGDTLLREAFANG